MSTFDDKIMVSVICNAYNHGKYIRDALEGFVMQETSFPFEVLVHDDASTDNTADIIREYESKYPELIKPIYQVENQFSKGLRVAALYQYPRAKGKYIALCEGDDYWTDPKKLQKQFDALESHPEVDICAHETVVIKAKNGKTLRHIAPAKEECILKAEDVIYGEGDFVATNSLMLKPQLVLEPMKFRQHLSLDYTLQIQGALKNGILYLNECMSVYRFMVAGSWTKRMAESSQKRKEFYQKKQQMLDILNDETDKKYDSVIQRRKLRNEFAHKVEQDDFKGIFSEKYRSVYKEYPLIERMKIRIKAYLPFLINIKRRLFK